MEKIWLHAYPEGVPAHIDAEAYPSIVAMVDEAIQNYAERPAFVCMGRQLSYAELDQASRAFACYLQQSLRLPLGSRVAIMLPNLLQYPVAMLGVLRAGMVVVNVNPLYTPRELEHQLNDSGALAMLVLDHFAHTLDAVRPHVPLQHVMITRLGDMLGFPKGPLINFALKHIKRMVRPYQLPGAARWQELMRQGRTQQLLPVSIHSQDLAFLQYTGGTTGIAKGAMLSHRNMVANVMQASAWIRPAIVPGQEVILTALPLYHIFSLLANCLTFMKHGGLNVLVPNPRDIPNLIQVFRQHRLTAVTGVNTLFRALLNHPDFARLDFSSLRLTLGGGMAVQKAVADQWHQVTGNPLIEAYGLTETSPAVTINPLSLRQYNGAIGLPIPSTEISIRDDEGHEQAVGGHGELWVRGPQVMQGYWNRPDETAKVMDAQGFLATGDIGSVDAEGYIRLIDRKKDMILVSGFNVYPNEIEDVVAQHPEVLEVACIGVPDDCTGEAVKIFVVRKNPALDTATLIAHCKTMLTRYKVPKWVEFRPELPKTNVGKIMRRALRDESVFANPQETEDTPPPS